MKEFKQILGFFSSVILFIRVKLLFYMLNENEYNEQQAPA